MIPGGFLILSILRAKTKKMFEGKEKHTIVIVLLIENRSHQNFLNWQDLASNITLELIDDKGDEIPPLKYLEWESVYSFNIVLKAFF